MTVLWRVGSHVLECGPRTLLMGVINVTPDSFSDGGWFLDPEAAVARGLEMVHAGADVLDVGGESTRPGSEPVPPQEELGRVIPVIERLAAETDGPLSIDTRKPEVARAALEAGASIVNDVSSGGSPGMFEVVRTTGAGMILMHMRGTPATMQQLTDYDDVVSQVLSELSDRLRAAVDAGIEPERLAVDPGLGFAKTFEQNLLLMRYVDRFLELGRPVVAGPSRKSFIGRILDDAPVDRRAAGTAGAAAWLAGRGAHVVRVHDPEQIVDLVRVVDAIRTAR